jgi:hypothetical protein
MVPQEPAAGNGSSTPEAAPDHAGQPGIPHDRTGNDTPASEPTGIPPIEPDPSLDDQPGYHLSRFIEVFLADAGQIVTEVRAVQTPQRWGGPKVEFGFFELSQDMPRPSAFGKELLDNLLARTPEMQPEGIYVTINPVKRDLLARAYNRLKVARQEGVATEDKHITMRRWLVIDADPDREPKISSTDEEKAHALHLITGVREDLRSRGWPEPAMVIDSGNGYHLWYRIDLPAKDDGVVERLLKSLAARHDTAEAHVDTSIHNPARIIKLPGTWARKGDSIPERPHRLSRVLEVSHQ